MEEKKSHKIEAILMIIGIIFFLLFSIENDKKEISSFTCDQISNITFETVYIPKTNYPDKKAVRFKYLDKTVILKEENPTRMLEIFNYIKRCNSSFKITYRKKFLNIYGQEIYFIEKLEPM